MNSMTGFGSKEAQILPLGKVSVEIRSTNHKSLESILHLPAGFLSWEDKIKKEIEAKIKRGRVTCVMNISGGQPPNIFINKELLKNYIWTLKNIKKQFHISDEARLDTLINLPGVLSLEENRVLKATIWPNLKALVRRALGDLLKMRQKEGRALCFYLKNRTGILKTNLDMVKTKFKQVIKERLAGINSDEERSSFLKNTDITEEMERLDFHIKNFRNKLSQAGPMGKELDFIAQEMQREANTMGAKSCDAPISLRVIQIKSQIEKVREQLQNIE